MEEELKRLTISNNKNMGIIEELQKANQTLKMQIKALSSDTQLPQNSVVYSNKLVLYSRKKRKVIKRFYRSILGFRFTCFWSAASFHFSQGCLSTHICGSICFCLIHFDESG